MEILKFPNARLREKSQVFNLKDDNERLEIIQLVQEMQDIGLRKLLISPYVKTAEYAGLDLTDEEKWNILLLRQDVA